MGDILSQGGDREPRPWLRRVAAIAAAVLVAALVVQQLASHRHAPARPGRAAAAGSPAPPASGTAPYTSSLTLGRGGAIGHTEPWQRSLRLPVTGEQPAWFWPGTGRTTPIGGLPRDTSGYLFIRVGGGWAVQPGSAAGPGCGSCAGRPVPVYFLGDRAQSVTPVGTANQVAPAATAGAVWLTSYPPGADLQSAAGTAREVSAGARPGPLVRLPAGYVIDQATDRGLLLAPAIRRPGVTADKLWDPAAPRVSRSFDGVIAASAGQIAWATRCDPLCQVHVLDLATGRRTLVTLPGASSAANAAFSPGGGSLAVELSFYDDGALATQLDVASAATGRLTVVPGTWASSDALAGFGWPADGGTLVAELSFTTRLEVTSWRPGAARLAAAVVRSGPNSATLIVG